MDGKAKKLPPKSEATHAYVGIAPCGCFRWLSVDDPLYAADIAKGISAFVKRGYVVEHMEIEKSRVSEWNCKKPDCLFVDRQGKLL